MKDFKVVSFDIHNSLFDILRFNIVLAETMLKAGMTVAHKRGVTGKDITGNGQGSFL